MNSRLARTRLLSIFSTSCLLLSTVSEALTGGNETLQFFEEEAQVMTASRRKQSILEVPSAVDIITPEEIKASGATNVWDLLRFRVGMDVIDGRSSNGNRAVVSERGFPHEFAGNLLVLIDGRSVYNANDAGVYWEQLPVQLQDIERIEIVRGPNAALYGTGAGVGVINMITKKPQGETALEVDARGGSLGMVQAFQAVETSFKKASLRISHTFQQQDGFPLASNSTVAGQDFLHKNVVNLRANLALSERSGLELLGGGSLGRAGIPGGSTYDDYSQHFQMLKFSHKFSEGSTLEVSGARNDHISTTLPTSGQTVRLLQYDQDILHRLSWGDDKLNTTYGAGYRNGQVTAPAIYGSFRPRIELYRGYLHQTIRVADPLTLQGALSLESANIAGVHPNYQLASVWTPVPAHALRISYSVANTLRDMVPLYSNGLVTPELKLVGDSQLEPHYKITSYEGGYHGTYLDNRLQTDIGLFYTKIDHFHNTFLESVTFPPPLVTLKFKIHDDAIARGTELKLKYRSSQSRWVYANYTYEHVTDMAGDRGFITDNVPAHKINLGGMVELVRGLAGSVNLGYKDKQFITSAAGDSAGIPAYWRFDARLAYILPWYKDSEIYVSGQNLLKPTHVEWPDGLAVPRTYSGGVSIKF